MKKTIYVLIAAAGFSITACTDSAQSKKPQMEKHDSTHKEKRDRYPGHENGGNELDSKKNNPSAFLKLTIMKQLFAFVVMLLSASFSTHRIL